MSELDKLRRELERCLGDIRCTARDAHRSASDAWRALVAMFAIRNGDALSLPPTAEGAANPAEVRAVLRGLVAHFERRAAVCRDDDDDALWTFRHRRLASLVDEELAAYIKLVAPPASVSSVFARATQRAAPGALRGTDRDRAADHPVASLRDLRCPAGRRRCRCHALRRLRLLRQPILHRTPGGVVMLSWFKRSKPPQATPQATNDAATAEAAVDTETIARSRARSRATALIAQWDRKIADATARAEALLTEAVAASQPLIEATRADLTPLVLPWNTIPPRIRELCEEISNAWNAISDEMSDSGEFTHEALRDQGCKRDLATCELELLLDRANGQVMARAAERMRVLAVTSDASALSCSQCGAKLDGVTPVAQSLNVACHHCKAVNTVHPGDALRAFAMVGAMHLAAEAARPANETMRRLETRIKQYRNDKDVPLALLLEFEAVTREHWTTRLSCEARHNPDEQKYVAAKLERYMKDCYRTLRRYWQWREHEAKSSGAPS